MVPMKIFALLDFRNRPAQVYVVSRPVGGRGTMLGMNDQRIAINDPPQRAKGRI